MKSDLEIAQNSTKRPIREIAHSIGIPDEDLILNGDYITKVPFGFTNRLQDKPDGKLILMTAMTPTSDKKVECCYQPRFEGCNPSNSPQRSAVF